MTPQQIELVQSTWDQVKPDAEKVAALFYARLFELDPSLQSLFKGDMKEQGKKLMATRAYVEHSLGYGSDYAHLYRLGEWIEEIAETAPPGTAR